VIMSSSRFLEMKVQYSTGGTRLLERERERAIKVMSEKKRNGSIVLVVLS